LEQGAAELAHMVEANHRQLPTAPVPQVAITGGLGTAKTVYREKLEAAIRRRVPGVHIPDLFMSPTAGAVLLAMEQAGVSMTPEMLNNLKSTGGQ
jgi:hypothetical protein